MRCEPCFEAVAQTNRGGAPALRPGAGHRVGALVLSFCLSLVSACSVPGLDLDARQCPCTTGWVCDSATNMCVREGTLRGDDSVALDASRDPMEKPGAASEPDDDVDASQADIDDHGDGQGGYLPPDASALDASEEDASAPDSGVPHAGSVDSGRTDAGGGGDCTDPCQPPEPAGRIFTTGDVFVESQPIRIDYAGIEGVSAVALVVYLERAVEPLERHVIALAAEGATAGHHTFAALPAGDHRFQLVGDDAILDELVVKVLPDADGDGTPDAADGCPGDPDKDDEGRCGCGAADTDTDGDELPDCVDECPTDAGKTAPGVCGCGRVDQDKDGDGAPDCVDSCDEDPAKTSPQVCGCGMPDVDSDEDGALDCQDDCPEDRSKTKRGLCGCGVAEASCPPAVPVLYEAEDASARHECVLSSEHEGFTGTGFVNYGDSGSWSEWSGVDAGSGGTFRLDLRYANPYSLARPCDVLVDGKLAAQAMFGRAGADWTSWAVESLELELTAGPHTIRIVASPRWGPNLDHLVLTQLSQ